MVDSPSPSTRGWRLLLWSAVLLAMPGCGAPERDDAAAASAAGGDVASPPPETQDGPAPFVEVTAATGIDFVHWNGMAGRWYYSEMMGSGAALFDVDRDGDLDLYLVQGAAQGVSPADSTFPPPESMQPLRDRLYLNEGSSAGRPGEDGMPRFVDVTADSGLDARGYGMGVAAADFDGDGWTDLYLTNLGDDELWRNLGLDDQGVPRFEKVETGARVSQWTVPVAVFDLERDGDLDLFLGGYVRWTPAVDKQCNDELGHRNYCGPLAYPPAPDTLLRNRGDGTFDDVTGRSGLGAVDTGPALGALATDVDGDGWTDLYVANDGSANHLWHHPGAPAGSGEVPRFEEIALLAGASVNGLGQPEASMGVEAGDVDGDGDEDLFVTHLTRETNTLYLAQAAAATGFTDRSTESGLGTASFDRTGFGTALVDWDLDGDLDVAVVNGAVKVIKELALAGDPYPLHQPNQLFRNRGPGAPGTFEEIDGGDWGAHSEVSRAAVFGDLDGDGDADAIVTQNAGPARLYRNAAGDGAGWIGFRFPAAEDSPGLDAAAHAVGVEVEILIDGTPGEVVRRKRLRITSGYLSSHDQRLVFGLGRDQIPAALSIVVRWPQGAEERFDDLATGRYHALHPGGGSGLQ